MVWVCIMCVGVRCEGYMRRGECGVGVYNVCGCEV